MISQVLSSDDSVGFEKQREMGKSTVKNESRIEGFINQEMKG